MRVVLGTGWGEEFRPADFAFFRRSRDRVLAALAGGGETYPWLVAGTGLASSCRFVTDL